SRAATLTIELSRAFTNVQENRQRVRVVNKDHSIFIYKRDICSHVETGLWSVYITYFPAITCVLECDTCPAFSRSKSCGSKPNRGLTML
uniref:Uncharacterized protein n=1 Tax=Cyclopterus lumpus TaxID=8103 RepID=A0A8C3AGA9_CYCLU